MIKRLNFWLFFCIIFGIILLIALFVYNYVAKKTVTLNPSAGSIISLGMSSGDSPAPSKIIIQTSSSTTIKLKKGVYKIEFSAEGYKSQYQILNLTNNTAVNSPAFSYTQEKLDSLLAVERDSARASINGLINPALYNFDNELLYEQGNWYSARLVPKMWYEEKTGKIPKPVNYNNKLDILRVISKKENGQWKVVAQPSLVFYKNDYKDIPEHIIKTADNAGFN